MQQKLIERRCCPRFELACPIELFDDKGQSLCCTDTIDVSNGGALVAAPAETAPAVGTIVKIELGVPNSTVGNRETRTFTCLGKITRHQDAEQGNTALGIEFLEPLELGLDEQ